MKAPARETILSRIRKNLRAPGSSPESDKASFADHEPHRSAMRSGEQEKSLIEAFEAELTVVGGHLIKVSSREELIISLMNLLSTENYKSIVLSREIYLEDLNLRLALENRLSGSSVSSAIAVASVTQLREADVGITGCEFLIAETGTVVLCSSPAAPRTLSLLPRAHVVVASEEQVVPTAAVCLKSMQESGGNAPTSSCITFVTGPSRTADIEKVLVKGVHGPKELYVFVLVRPKES